MVDGGNIISGLVEAGLEEGDVVLTHSSLNRFGKVDGGADTVIDAILEAIGPSGTLLMPTFTIWDGRLFDARSRPADKSMGKIPETLRRRVGTRRSAHPTHSVAAIGAKARELTEGHEKCIYSYGHGSPFEKLIDADGKILLLGLDQRINSSVHCFEDIHDNYPIRRHLLELYEVDVIDCDGVKSICKTKRFDPAVSNHRDYQAKDGFLKLDIYLREHGMMTETRIGNAPIRLMKSLDLMFALEELLKKGITIYTGL